MLCMWMYAIRRTCVCNNALLSWVAMVCMQTRVMYIHSRTYVCSNNPAFFGYCIYVYTRSCGSRNWEAIFHEPQPSPPMKCCGMFAQSFVGQQWEKTGWNSCALNPPALLNLVVCTSTHVVDTCEYWCVARNSCFGAFTRERLQPPTWCCMHVRIRDRYVSVRLHKVWLCKRLIFLHVTGTAVYASLDAAAAVANILSHVCTCIRATIRYVDVLDVHTCVNLYAYECVQGFSFRICMYSAVFPCLLPSLIWLICLKNLVKNIVVIFGVKINPRTICWYSCRVLVCCWIILYLVLTCKFVFVH